MKVIQLSRLTLKLEPKIRLSDFPLYYEPVNEARLNSWARAFRKGTK